MPDRAEAFARAYFEQVRAAKLKKPPGQTLTYDEAMTLLLSVYHLHHAKPVSRAIPALPSPFGDARRVPPSPEQVTAYSASVGYPMDGQRWCDHYAEKGWAVGKAGKRMKDWQCAVRNWKTNGWGHGSVTLGVAPVQGTPDPTNGYTKF